MIDKKNRLHIIFLDSVMRFRTLYTKKDSNWTLVDRLNWFCKVFSFHKDIWLIVVLKFATWQQWLTKKPYQTLVTGFSRSSLRSMSQDNICLFLYLCSGSRERSRLPPTPTLCDGRGIDGLLPLLWIIDISCLFPTHALDCEEFLPVS